MSASAVFEFDGTEEIAALKEFGSALERFPDFRDYIVSRFDGSSDALIDFIGIPLVSSSTIANKMIVRFQPSKGLSELLAAIPAKVRTQSYQNP